jgi:hypothetical protein
LDHNSHFANFAMGLRLAGLVYVESIGFQLLSPPSLRVEKAITVSSR